MKLILSVEDNDLNQKLIYIRLSKLKHKVVQVNNAQGALEALDELTPDLLLIDLSLPDLDGVELIVKIRSHHSYKYVPIILVSSFINDKLKSKIDGLSVVDCLQKPIDFKHLAELIDDIAA